VNKYRKFIKKGVIESLDKVPFHGKAPIKRLSMLSKSLIPKSNTHIAVHFVDASKDLPKYSKLHKHNHDEINLILSRQYKLLKRDNREPHIIKKKERILKLITIGVIAATIIFFIMRYYNLV